MTITVETLGSSSKGNCYRLLSGGRSLLLECGLPWREIQRKINFQTSALDGCLVTHAHKDHCRAAGDLMRAGIDLYATPETLEAMAVERKFFHRFHPVTRRLRFEVADHWRVLPFETYHDSPGSLGFQVDEIIGEGHGDRLVFLTDTAFSYFTFLNVDIYMIEANFGEKILADNLAAGRIDKARAKRVRESHMSIERVIDMLRANDLSRCRHIHLLHGSDGNSDSALFKRMVQEVTGIPVTVEG